VFNLSRINSINKATSKKEITKIICNSENHTKAVSRKRTAYQSEQRRDNRVKKKGGRVEAIVEQPEGKRPPGRLKLRWENNTKMDLKETGWDGVDWFHLA
jgi:ribosomal protein L19E